MKKDMEWTIGEVSYVIRNVPHEVYEAEGIEFFDLGVAVNVTALRDLMVSSMIEQTDVDYEIIKDFRFDS